MKTPRMNPCVRKHFNRMLKARKMRLSRPDKRMRM